MIELWFIYALISAFAVGLTAIIHRFILKGHDWLSYSVVTNLLTALLFIPLMINNFTLPTSQSAYYILLLSILLWTIIVAVSFKSYQHIEVSLRGPLDKIKIPTLLILSYIFLSEPMTRSKVLGTILIFFSAALITFKKNKILDGFSDRGVQLTLLSALLLAIVNIVDKVAMSYWSPAMFGFLLYLFPGMIIGILIPKRKNELSKLLRLRLWPVIVVTVLSFVFYYFRLKAYAIGEVSNVYPILNSGALISMFGGVILLKERKDIMKKIISAVIMFIGILLVAGYV